jgi:hypothetical protein
MLIAYTGCQAQYPTLLKIHSDPTVDNARGFYPSLITVTVLVWLLPYWITVAVSTTYKKAGL